jgi:hypothetical protein
VKRPRASPAKRRRRPVTWQAVCRAARSLPGVQEGTSYGTRSLHVRKKLLARLREDGDSIAVRTDMVSREFLLRADPGMYFLTDHYREYPWILVRLADARLDPLSELLEAGWRQLATKRVIAEYDLIR